MKIILVNIITIKVTEFSCDENFLIFTLGNFQTCNKISLTTAAMLYIISPLLTYFITGSLYLLSLFTHFAHPPPAATNLFSIFELGFCLLDSPYK